MYQAAAAGAVVYPRVCGGSPGRRLVACISAGLSPRVRGKRLVYQAAAAGAGSIPACAGEAACGLWICRKAPVYPRVCGGSAVSIASAKSIMGLSPRVRGKPGNSVHCLLWSRSIPACAGEAAERKGVGQLAWVYPRVCGGSLPVCSSVLAFSGLSPRVRGKRP